MGKRAPRKTLDQDDLESDDNDHTPFQGDAKDIDDQAAIAKRKIVTIKRRAPPSGSGDAKPAGGGFNLTTALPTMGAADKPQGSLFGNPTTDPKPMGSLFGNPNGTKLTSQSLFGGDSAATKTSGSLFGGPAKPAAAGSLFGGEIKPSGSLFGGDTKPTGSLFGNSTNGGLFGSKPAEGGSLFGNTSGSLFGSNGAPASGSLFGAKPTGGLFGDKPAGTTLFGGKPGESLFGQQKSIFGEGFGKKDDNKKDDEEDADGNYIAPDEPPTVAIEDATAIKSPFTKLFEREIQKFKIDKPADKKKNCGIGKVSLQKCEFGQDDSAKITLFKVIFKNSIGKILYEGTILNKASKIRAVVEKAHKNQVKIAVACKDVDGLKTQYCKLNFQRAEDQKGFEEEFNKALDFMLKASEEVKK